MARLNCPLLVSGSPVLPARLVLARRTVPVATAAEQRALWAAAIDGQDSLGACTAAVEQAVQRFRFSVADIAAVAGELRADGANADRLLALCRERARAAVPAFVERIEPQAGWHRLVLPPAQEEVLRHLVRQVVRHRREVYETWGFEAVAGRSTGTTALFAGESGTGKSLAAEVLAAELGVDLYRVDLSAVVSKYIGETEKNLRAVFDAAERSGALLLFDEADAVFGRRSEVRDSHDRYANQEIAC